MKEAKKTKNGKGGSKSTSAEHEGNDGSTSNLETDGSTLATRGDGEDQTSTNGKRIQELETEIAGLVVRTKPLGLDRDYRRYWFFEQDGRVFVEDPATKMWRFYSEWDEIEEVYRGLDGRGVRERALKTALDSSRDLICAGLQRKQGEEEERRATRRSRSAPSVRWRNKFC